MPTIYLTASKQVDFKGILNDSKNNLQPIIGETPYDFLVDELEKLHDLYIELENDKEALEKDNSNLNKQVDNLEKEVRDLQRELSEKE